MDNCFQSSLSNDKSHSEELSCGHFVSQTDENELLLCKVCGKITNNKLIESFDRKNSSTAYFSEFKHYFGDLEGKNRYFSLLQSNYNLKN